MVLEPPELKQLHLLTKTNTFQTQTTYWNPQRLCWTKRMSEQASKVQMDPSGFQSVAPPSPWSSLRVFSLHAKSVSAFGHLVSYYRYLLIRSRTVVAVFWEGIQGMNRSQT